MNDINASIQGLSCDNEDDDEDGDDDDEDGEIISMCRPCFTGDTKVSTHVRFSMYTVIIVIFVIVLSLIVLFLISGTVLPAKSDSDVMFWLQSYHGLIIDISLVY